MQNLFKLRQALLAFAILLTATLTYGQTQSGTLDPSFGSGGTAINDFGGRIALLPDGKILAAGGASAVDGFDFSLSRFNSNGTLDTTFGSGGRVTTDLGGRFEGATSIAIQPDGKIIAGGYAVVPVNQFANFALVRYNSDGSLDLSFGTGGKVITSFGNISAQAYSLALQPDGKIVLGGYVNFNGGESFGLARYNTDGTLDAGFGSGGKVHTEFSAAGQTSSLAFAYDVALQQDGKIVAAGESTINGQRDFALARYNSNGTLDPGFGTGGKLNTDFVGFDDLARDVTIQPDGRIVAGGAAASGSAASVLFNFALARYNSNGTLDATFGAGGKVTTDFSGAQDFVNSVVLQPDGRIIAAGAATINGVEDEAFGLARYFSNGTLDPSFGSGGKLTTNFGPGLDQIGQLVLLQDGNMLAAGGADINGTSKSVLARYLNDSSSPFPTPSPTPSGESSSNTRTPPATQIVDSNGDVWTRSANGAILRNGTGTAGSGSQILYCNRVVYVFGADSQWWRWTNGWTPVGTIDPCGGSTATPTPTPNPTPTPAQSGESVNNTRTPPATQIVDSNGDVWIRSANGAILRNGASTGGVGSQILYCSRSVYVFGTDSQWWRWTNGWIPVGTIDPCGGSTATPTPTPTPAQSAESANNTRTPPATQIVDSNGGVWSRSNNGAILRNGAATGGVGSQILYCNRSVYVFGTDSQWWRWTNSWMPVGPVDPCGGN